MNKKIRTRLLTFVGSLIAVAIIGINTNPTPTPTYAESSSANASVTVANTINLTLTGGDLLINNLTPGNAADSNSITATVTSNSPFGFHLAATTGTSTGTDSLVNTADSNFTFANLSTNKASLSNFSDNTWGYSYSTDGTNWISGDYGSAITGYNGLPLDNNDSGATSTTLFNSDSYLGSKAVQFKIGAKSATTQAAGTYVGTINFYAVTNPEPTPYMQDLTTTKLNQLLPNVGDTTIAIDKRDEQSYTIAKLADNNYWMLDNLRLNPASLTQAELYGSDVQPLTNASNTTLNYLKHGGGTPSNQYPVAQLNYAPWTSYSQNVYGMPLVISEYINTTTTGYGSGSGKTGVFYNYCAATAGSYCYGDTNTGTSIGDATEDLCPARWRLPTGGPAGEFQSLCNAIKGSSCDNSWSISGLAEGSLQNNLSTPLSGWFYSGSVSGQGSSGIFWSSTRSDNYSMYSLEASSTSVYPQRGDYVYRSEGHSIRCIFNP